MTTETKKSIIEMIETQKNYIRQIEKLDRRGWLLAWDDTHLCVGFDENWKPFVTNCIDAKHFREELHAQLYAKQIVNGRKESPKVISMSEYIDADIKDTKKHIEEFEQLISKFN